MKKGIWMTFESDGIPIIQKHVSNSNAIVEKPDYDLSSEFLVTNITKKYKGTRGLKPTLTTALQNNVIQYKENQNSNTSELKFEGHIKDVIEAIYAKPSQNMLIQSGFSIIEQDKVT